MKSLANVPRKRPYQAPKLTKYGSLTQMTAAHGLIAGAFDNPGMDNHKTQ
jgi:hypothetical protein